jgi:HCOMODA/2-hydroxy-3-carboxy-muconic semialdehyde decarboxylase
MSADAERAAAIDSLVTANHILANEAVFDDGYGHVSVRDPRVTDRFLMSSAVSPAVVTVGDIMEYDLSGEPIDGQGRLTYVERYIHSEIYAARPEVNAIVHSHSPSVIAFGVVDVPLRGLFHVAHFLSKGAPVFDLSAVEGQPTNALITSAHRGKALVEALGEAPVILMRGHGYTVVGPTIEMAAQRAVVTIINARIQTTVLALAEGRPITYFSPEEAALFGGQSTGSGARRSWDMWLSKLDSK